ncbi:MAG TPA: GTP 3',8-cyclase MoaA [Casimicrobiaceae bacterium]|nr:GTP 3',8-cyclase MoaA [Casimicrobiaceae bacterium]
MATFIPLTDVRAQGREEALAAFVRDAARAPVAPGPVLDARQRPLSDLRISVTDRCNFRCVYCMPKDVFGRDYPFLPHDALLTFEEITRVARVFVGLGVRKLRLTGGEPLLRRNIERLVEMLRGISDDLDITLTTNGALLARKARELKAAGLSRVTVSLDSLDDATFRAMNDVDFPVGKVLEGIDAAADAGLAPLKINMVVKRGTNEGSIVPMARRFRGTGHVVRFIEYMDVGATNGWRMDEVVPARDVVAMIHAQMPLVCADPHYRGEVAERWTYADGSGEIGVIASVTQAFCRDCTRARLSTEGQLYTCLFANDGFDLREIIRGGGDEDHLRRVIAAIWRQREDRYSEIRTAQTARAPKVEMSYIGG